MDPLMNKVEEIAKLKEEYNIGSYDVATLQLLAIIENNNMTYEKLKQEIISRKNK